MNNFHTFSALAFGCHFPSFFGKVLTKYLPKKWRKMAPKSFAENIWKLFIMSSKEVTA